MRFLSRLFGNRLCLLRFTLPELLLIPLTSLFPFTLNSSLFYAELLPLVLLVTILDLPSSQFLSLLTVVSCSVILPPFLLVCKTRSLLTELCLWKLFVVYKLRTFFPFFEQYPHVITLRQLKWRLIRRRRDCKSLH